MLYKHGLQFSLSLGDWIPRATVGTVTTAAQCARVSSVTKSHGGTTLGTDWAHSRWENVPWQRLRMPRDHHRILSTIFIPRDLSQIKLFHHWGLPALNPSQGLPRHREVPEGPF